MNIFKLSEMSEEKKQFILKRAELDISEQMKVAKEVSDDIYPIRDVVGHSVITPRKIDPGPALEYAFSEFQDKN